MSIRIITTSKESQFKKKTNNCPECGSSGIGMGHGETKGIFKIKHRRITKTTCIKCGCVWEYTGEWE